MQKLRPQAKKKVGICMTECISVKVYADIHVQRLFPQNISSLIPLRPDDDLHVLLAFANVFNERNYPQLHELHDHGNQAFAMSAK